MPSIQGKARVARMIEFRVGPISGRVAVSALLPAATIVGVVVGVAVEAYCRRADKSLVFMTTGALGLRVLADQ
jgi:hypothetical protein